jgi:hypothetical protein
MYSMLAFLIHGFSIITFTFLKNCPILVIADGAHL